MIEVARPLLPTSPGYRWSSRDLTELEHAIVAATGRARSSSRWPLAPHVRVELAVLIADLDRLLPTPRAPRSATSSRPCGATRPGVRCGRPAPLLASATERPGGKGDWKEVRDRWASLGFAAITTLERHTAMLSRVECTSWLERLIALVSWPDDPRIVPLLVAWFITPPLTLNVRLLAGVMEVLADRLAELADARVLAQLAGCITEPRGIRVITRDDQRRLAAQIVDAIDRRTCKDEPALVAAIARCAERMPVREDTTRSDAQIIELWRGVIREPDDAAARMVLADALVERGDPRGELIVLQCSGAGARAEQLLRRHFATWMGDATLVVSRKLCVFRNGMLEEARLGIARTPPWAWRKLAGHRELGTLRAVRAGHALVEAYAELIATLPNLQYVQLDAPEMVVHLAALGARLPVTAIDYFDYNPTLAADRIRPAFEHVCEGLARCAPDLETLDFGLLEATQVEIADLVPTLPARLPRLRRIRIASRIVGEARQQLVERLPTVELY